jgi:serpin B
MISHCEATQALTPPRPPIKKVVDDVPTDPTVNPTMATLAAGNTAFAVDLYHELADGTDNVSFSQYSISSALGMDCAGACENTETEMKHALHFEMEQSRLPAAFQALSQKLIIGARKTEQKLAIANGLCLVNKDVSADDKTVTQNNYAAVILSGDVNSINDWVKQKTVGKIEKIIEELNSDAHFVLLNAMYFKGVWASPFESRRTRKDLFKISSAARALVPFMYQKSRLKLFVAKDFQAVELPYQGKLLSMVFVLPHEADGLVGLVH